MISLESNSDVRDAIRTRKKRENVGIFPHGRTAPLLYTWVLKVNDMEFWISDVALWSWCGGDEFECKYPAFTGISREIRCDLGEGDKARRGGSGWLGECFHYTHIFGKLSKYMVYPIYSATKYCVNIS